MQCSCGTIFGILPTVFDGASVSIVDAAAITTVAPLFYVSPTEVDFQIPSTVATGLAKVIVGDDIPEQLLNPQDLAVRCPGMAAAGDDAAPSLHVLVGQLIAFFQCMQQGLRPDSPSVDGVISRVVESFRIHRPVGERK